MSRDSDRKRVRQELNKAREALCRELHVLQHPSSQFEPPDNHGIVEKLEAQLREIDVELAKGVGSDEA
jgi:hypothetical protein